MVSNIAMSDGILPLALALSKLIVFVDIYVDNVAAVGMPTFSSSLPNRSFLSSFSGC